MGNEPVTKPQVSEGLSKPSSPDLADLRREAFNGAVDASGDKTQAKEDFLRLFTFGEILANSTAHKIALSVAREISTSDLSSYLPALSEIKPVLESAIRSQAFLQNAIVRLKIRDPELALNTIQEKLEKFLDIENPKSLKIDVLADTQLESLDGLGLNGSNSLQEELRRSLNKTDTDAKVYFLRKDLSLLDTDFQNKLTFSVKFGLGVSTNTAWQVIAQEVRQKVVNILCASAIIEQAVKAFPHGDAIQAFILRDSKEDIFKDSWTVLTNQHLERILELTHSDKQIQLLENVSEDEVLKVIKDKEWRKKIDKLIEKGLEKSVKELGKKLRETSCFSDQEFNYLLNEITETLKSHSKYSNISNTNLKLLAYQLIEVIVNAEDVNAKVDRHIAVLDFLKEGDTVQEILAAF